MILYGQKIGHVFGYLMYDVTKKMKLHKFVAHTLEHVHDGFMYWRYKFDGDGILFEWRRVEQRLFDTSRSCCLSAALSQFAIALFP